MAVVMAGSMAAIMSPAAALAQYAPQNNTGKAVMTSESTDSWGTGTLKKTVNSDVSVSYTGIVHSDLAHYNGYGLTTKITTDSKGLITAIDLSSGDETFAGAWGYKNVAKSVTPIEGYLPDGVTFSATKNPDGTYTPNLEGADRYGTAAVASPSRGGSGVAAYKATASGAEEVADGATYNADSNTVVVNDDSVNLVKVTYQIGAEKLYFNVYFAVGDDDAQDAANAYIDTIQPTTWDADPDLTGTMGATDRDCWTAIMGTIYQQRVLQSWGAFLQNDSLTSEVDDLDTVSGATKTSDPFVASLNQAVLDGYVKGVAENVKVTIDGGKLDINANPEDRSTVTVNSDGRYVLDNIFPASTDTKEDHSVSLARIDVYQTGAKLTTKDIQDIAKNRSAYKSTTYTAEGLGLNPTEKTNGRTGQTVTEYSWGDFSNDLIDFDYDADNPERTITAKNGNVDVIALTYTIGHAEITIAYDLKQMKAAGDVESQIAALTTSSSTSDIIAARTAYNALSTDVRGFVGNIETLEKAESGLTMSRAAITLSKSSYIYTGSALKPGVAVKLGSAKLKAGTDYAVSYKNNKNAGTATVTVTGKGSFSGTKTATFKIAKASQKLTVSTAKKTVKASALKKRAQTTSRISVKGAKAKLSYQKISGSSKLKVSKTGKITVAKKTKKGTYKVKVKVAAANTSNYKASSASATVKVVVR